MNQTQAIAAAEALMQQPSFAQIADYLAQTDTERLDQSAAGREKIARNLAWQQLQATSYTDSERRDIMEPLLALILQRRVVAAQTIGDRQIAAGESASVGERVLVCIESVYVTALDAEDEREAGWYTSWTEPTEEEMRSASYQQVAARHAETQAQAQQAAKVARENRAAARASEQVERARYDAAHPEARAAHDREVARLGIDQSLLNDLFGE